VIIVGETANVQCNYVRCVADETKKGHLRRRSGDGTDLGASLYSYPAGTHPTTLAQYKVLRSTKM